MLERAQILGKIKEKKTRGVDIIYPEYSTRYFLLICPRDGSGGPGQWVSFAPGCTIIGSLHQNASRNFADQAHFVRVSREECRRAQTALKYISSSTQWGISNQEDPSRSLWDSEKIFESIASACQGPIGVWTSCPRTRSRCFESYATRTATDRWRLVHSRRYLFRTFASATKISETQDT